MKRELRVVYFEGGQPYFFIVEDATNEREALYFAVETYRRLIGKIHNKVFVLKGLRIFTEKVNGEGLSEALLKLGEKLKERQLSIGCIFKKKLRLPDFDCSSFRARAQVFYLKVRKVGRERVVLAYRISAAEKGLRETLVYRFRMREREVRKFVAPDLARVETVEVVLPLKKKAGKEKVDVK